MGEVEARQAGLAATRSRNAVAPLCGCVGSGAEWVSVRSLPWSARGAVLGQPVAVLGLPGQPVAGFGQPVAVSVGEAAMTGRGLSMVDRRGPGLPWLGKWRIRFMFLFC